jgi:hypothetical protein
MAVSLPAIRSASMPVLPFGLRPRRVLGILLVVIGLVAAINLVPPPDVGLLIAIALIIPVIWSVPLRGLYFVVGGAVTIETFALGFPDSLTDRIPLFEGLNRGALNLNGLSINPMEILFGVVLVRAFAMATPEIRSRLVRGKLFIPYAFVLLAVLVAEVHGLFASGDFNLSLWELRPQVYGFLAFLIASLVIRSRRDVEGLALVVAVCVALKAMLGDFRYFILLGHQLGTHETILGHEDSYFLGLLVIGLIAALIWVPRSDAVKWLLIGSPLALAALLANERRVGMLAFGAGLVMVVVLAIRYHPTRWRRIAVFAMIAAGIAVIFLAIFWNQQTGLIGQFVRPIRSQFDPTYRDYLSDLYRQAENANLKLSFDTNKLIGMGFGMPYLTVFTQADISSIYPLWNVIPHNTLMWIGVRMGYMGLVAFFGLFAAGLFEVCYLMRTIKDRFLLALVSMAGAALIAELVVGYGDLQLESYRNMIFIGVVFGVINVLPGIIGASSANDKQKVA